jgi:hypothetical protein
MVTLKLAVVFGTPALVLAVCIHVLMPRWPVMILSALLVVEIFAALFAVTYELHRQGTGMEVLALPGLIVGIVVGNLLALPIAKRIRAVVR